MKVTTCQTCNAKTQSYRHSLNQALITGLMKLWNATGKHTGFACNLKDLKLTRNQWDNFQKLRYWGLVEKSVDAYGKRLQGCWEITDHGANFIERGIRIPSAAITYRGRRTGFSGTDIGIADPVERTYRQRNQYAMDAETPC